MRSAFARPHGLPSGRPTAGSGWRVVGRAALGALLALATPAAAQAAFTLPGQLGHEYQRLNNCGPVTAKMVLSLSGTRVSQASAAAALKTSSRDRNVSVAEMAGYLEGFGLRTVRRWAGDPDLVRRLVRAGFPVILHQRMTLKDDIGHFRVAYGLDAARILTGDSFLGPATRLNDAELAALWRPYNGEFLVAYQPDREPALRAALGTAWDARSNLRRLAADTRTRVEADPADALAWWGLGQARLLLGAPRGAADAFLKAERLGLPARHYWYQHDALEAWNRVGWFELTERVATRNLAKYPNSSELGFFLEQARLGRAGKAFTRAFDPAGVPAQYR